MAVTLDIVKQNLSNLNFIQRTLEMGKDGQVAWEPDALKAVLYYPADLNTSAQAWAFAANGGLPAKDYDEVRNEVASDPNGDLATHMMNAAGYHKEVKPPREAVEAAIWRAGQPYEKVASNMTDRMSVGGLYRQDALPADLVDKAGQTIGWPKLMNEAVRWMGGGYSTTPQVAAIIKRDMPKAWPSLVEGVKQHSARTAALINRGLVEGDAALGDAANHVLHTVMRYAPDAIPKETWESIFAGKSGLPIHNVKEAMFLTPHREHHQAFLANADVDGALEHIRRNKNIHPDDVRAAVEKHGFPLVYGLAPYVYMLRLPPETVEKLADTVISSKDEDQYERASAASALISNSSGSLSTETMRKLLELNPDARSNIDPWTHPDLASEHQVNVAFNTNKLRQVRDLIRESGAEELPPNKLPAGDWKAFRNPNGNISAAKLQEAIDGAPRTLYNVTHSTWEGAQRHNRQESRVFQLNLSSEQMGRLKEAGAFDTFKRMHDAMTQSEHPIGPAGLGWVRWTKGDDGIHIDEVQSDLGQSFVKQAAAQAKQAVQNGQMTEEQARAAVEDAEEQYPEKHHKLISDIVFQGRHPSEVLQEAFQEWLRQPHVEPGGWGAKEVAKLPRDCPNQNCYSHTSGTFEGELEGAAPWHERNGTDPGNPNDPPHGHRCGDCGAYFKTHDWVKLPDRNVSHVGVPVHIWQPESKATISLSEPNEKLPGHFYVGYRDVPAKKLGWKPGEYGELQTQSGDRHGPKMSVVTTAYCPEGCGGVVNVRGEGSRATCGVCDASFQVDAIAGDGKDALIIGADERGMPKQHHVKLETVRRKLAPGKPTWKDQVRKTEVPADPNPPRAASVWVQNPAGHVLWGRRQKDGKWTLPGGHLEAGEQPAHGAVRELWEEAGIVPTHIQQLGVANGEGGLPVYIFHALADITAPQPHSKNDPDNEVAEWRWVDCLMGVPQDILGNLAHERNVVLRWLGHQKDQPQVREVPPGRDIIPPRAA